MLSLIDNNFFFGTKINKNTSKEQKIRNLYGKDPNADFSKLIRKRHKFSEKFMEEFPVEPSWKFNYDSP